MCNFHSKRVQGKTVGYTCEWYLRYWNLIEDRSGVGRGGVIAWKRRSDVLHIAPWEKSVSLFGGIWFSGICCSVFDNFENAESNVLNGGASRTQRHVLGDFGMKFDSANMLFCFCISISLTSIHSARRLWSLFGKTIQMAVIRTISSKTGLKALRWYGSDRSNSRSFAHRMDIPASRASVRLLAKRIRKVGEVRE